MNRIATRIDFLKLSEDAQYAHAQVLKVCAEERLSCRCEVVDERDFCIAIAPGLSAAKYWLDRLDIGE